MSRLEKLFRLGAGSERCLAGSRAIHFDQRKEPITFSSL